MKKVLCPKVGLLLTVTATAILGQLILIQVQETITLMVETVSLFLQAISMLLSLPTTG